MDTESQLVGGLFRRAFHNICMKRLQQPVFLFYLIKKNKIPTMNGCDQIHHFHRYDDMILIRVRANSHS